MRHYGIESIVSDVRICLDEIGKNDAEFDSGGDDSALDTIIKSKIEDALMFVLMNADYAFLEPSEVLSGYTTEKIGSSNLYKGKLQLSKSFLRLMTCNMVGWKRYLSHEDLVVWGDKAYAMLNDEYTTGTASRPRAALVLAEDNGTSSQNKKMLELYSGAEGEKSMAMVVNMPVLTPKDPAGREDEDYYNVPDAVCKALVYYIAGLTLVTLREAQASQIMFQQANELIGFTGQAQAVTMQQNAE